MRVLPRSKRGANSASSLFFRKNMFEARKEEIMQKRRKAKYHPRYATILDLRDMCINYSIWNVVDSVRSIHEKMQKGVLYKCHDTQNEFLIVDDFLKKMISMLGLPEYGENQMKPISIQEMINKDAQ